MRKSCLPVVMTAIALFPMTLQLSFAGGHTWRVNEMFSDATGAIQFVELRETGGGTGEVATAGHMLTSNSKTFTLTANVVSPTSFKTILLATTGFAALPGAPAPDYIIAGNFFSTNADTITYVPLGFVTFGAGMLPTDGVHSLNADLTTGVNSPKNYAGVTGSVNAAPAPPAVPDGSGTSTPMTVQALDTAGSSLSITWDVSSCAGAGSYQIIYGQGSQLPTVPGGTFGVSGSVCGLGSSQPFVWNSVPVATDGTGLLWWLVVASNGSGTEGSWGLNSAGAERVGPGAGGSSGQCAATARNLSNTCGH